MRSESEREFFKQFEKFLNSMEKQSKLAGEYRSLIAENDKLHYKFEKGIKRIFFRKTMFLKHGSSILDNVKNMKLSLYRHESFLNSRTKIINDIRNTATKIIDEDKKEMIMKTASLLEERVNLMREWIAIWRVYLMLSEDAGKYAIECGKGLMSKENFSREYYALCERTDFFGKKFDLNIIKSINLNNEIRDLLAKYDEIQDLFGENKEFKKFWKSNSHIRKQVGLKESLKDSFKSFRNRIN